jgi:hypothetical protein
MKQSAIFIDLAGPLAVFATAIATKRRNKMRMFRTALFLMVVSVLGCAGSQPVQLQLPPGARIGILNVLEPQMTHVDVGSLRINSFTNVYNVDWDIPGYISQTIENDLRAGGNYTFIPIGVNADTDWKQSMSNDILSAAKAWMPGDLKAYLQQAGVENRLDVIISVSSYDSGMWQENACFKVGKDDVVSTKGFGLFTRKRPLSGLSSLLPVGQNQAAAYANIIVAVFQPQPATLAAYAAAPCNKDSLPGFPWESDLQFLSPAVIQQVRLPVERLSVEAVQAALRNAGLLP